jgi:hypothetical protein
MRRSFRRPFAVVSTTVAVALLLTASAEAQRKKAAPAKKKPAATAPAPAPAQAKPKPDTTKPAEEAQAAEEKKPTKKVSDEDTEKPKETEKEKEPEKPSESSGGAKPTMVDFGVGIRGFQRHLGYKDDWNGTLPSYDLNGAPEAELTLGVFPIKNSNGSITAGLVGSFGYAFALGSTYKVPPMGSTTATKYTTKAMEFTVGAKVNFNFGTSSLGVAAEFGKQSFAVNLPPPPADHSNAGVPDVDYTFIRPSVSVRIGVMDKLAIIPSLGALIVLGAGQITTPAFFDSKNTSILGIDASLGAAYEIAHNIEIRPSLDFRRYGYKFSWSPASTILQAPYPAGGAIDQYYGASLLVGFRF